MKTIIALLMMGSSAIAADTNAGSVLPWVTSSSTYPTFRMIDPGCMMVMTNLDGEVTVDWGCVDRFANKYDPKNPEQMAGYALIFRAIRDGTAKTK